MFLLLCCLLKTLMLCQIVNFIFQIYLHSIDKCYEQYQTCLLVTISNLRFQEYPGIYLSTISTIGFRSTNFFTTLRSFSIPYILNIRGSNLFYKKGQLFNSQNVLKWNGNKTLFLEVIIKILTWHKNEENS